MTHFSPALIPKENTFALSTLIGTATQLDRGSTVLALSFEPFMKVTSITTQTRFEFGRPTLNGARIPRHAALFRLYVTTLPNYDSNVSRLGGSEFLLFEEIEVIQ